MALKVASRAYVLTHNGMREIQLCVGDITRLPLEDKVDVIMVSALPNNYMTTASSVIGQLLRKQRIDVGALALNKKEDLRQQFHCWLSQRLPDNVPYRQLLCYEKVSPGRKVHMLESVGEVFRAMMPIFNNANKTVITPLLATNIQGVRRGEMLQMLVKTAVNWQRMGLPLQVLKIVLYAPNPDKIGKREQPCLEVFQDLKKEIEALKTVPPEPSLQTDIFLVYCTSSEVMAKKFEKKLRKLKSDIRMKSIRQVSVKQETWHHDVYMAMMSSSRVVPLLAPDFMEDRDSLDQYNIALCCNRRAHRNVLAPVNIERCPNLPTYMNMVQWLDCRGGAEDKVNFACQTLVDQVKSNAQTVKLKYDVFISYSHRNLDQAKQVLNSLQHAGPNLKIFFDYEELKSGVAWQQTLYQAIDGARCMLALLSTEYAASAVCREEFRLALAKHTAKEKDLELIVLCMQDVDPEFHTKFTQPIKLPESGADETVMATCKSIAYWLETNEKNDSFFKEEISWDHFEATMHQRRTYFSQFYSFQDGNIQWKSPESVPTKNDVKDVINTAENDKLDVLFSYILSDQKYAQMLAGFLDKDMPNLKSLLKNQTMVDRLDFIEQTNCFVLLLSSQYLMSTKETEELHVILSKMRSSNTDCQMYVVWLDDLPRKPTYCHLIPCDTALGDLLWVDLTRDAPVMDEESVSPFSKTVTAVKNQVERDHGPMSDPEALALMKVSMDLKALLVEKRSLPYRQAKDCLFDNVVWVHEMLGTPESSSKDIARDNSITMDPGGHAHIDQYMEFQALQKVEQQSNESNTNDTEATEFFTIPTKLTTTADDDGDDDNEEADSEADLDQTYKETAEDCDDLSLDPHKTEAGNMNKDDQLKEKPVGRALRAPRASGMCTLI